MQTPQKRLTSLFENQNAWGEQTPAQEVTTRKTIQIEVLDAISKGEVEVKFGKNVDPSTVKPHPNAPTINTSLFESTEKVSVSQENETIEKNGTEELRTKYVVDLRVTDVSSRFVLKFHGTITDHGVFGGPAKIERNR